MILFRSLTGSARDYVMLHSKTDEYVDLKAAALRYESSSRIWTEISGNTNIRTTCTVLWMVGKREKEKGKARRERRTQAAGAVQQERTRMRKKRMILASVVVAKVITRQIVMPRKIPMGSCWT